MNLQNSLLIAAPYLKSYWLRKSVIYVCEHNENGAMGIMINKPIEALNIGRFLRRINIYENVNLEDIDLDQPVFAGGPSSFEQGLILHCFKEDTSCSIAISPNIMLTVSKNTLKTLLELRPLRNFLVAFGYTRWTKGQLEREIEDNIWINIKADEGIIFNTPFNKKWSTAAAKLHINLSNFIDQCGHA